MRPKNMFLGDIVKMCDPDYEGHGSVWFEDDEWNDLFHEED